MISSIGKWLIRTLLTNPRIKELIIANNHIMCVLFNLAHPDLLLAKITEKLSPWLGYRANIEIFALQIQRVYGPLYGSWAWSARVLHPDLGWYNLGSVHDESENRCANTRIYILMRLWTKLSSKELSLVVKASLAQRKNRS